MCLNLGLLAGKLQTLFTNIQRSTIYVNKILVDVELQCT